MYFSEARTGIPEKTDAFIQMLSETLERMNPSLLDRARCAIRREGEGVWIELPHREDVVFALKFFVHLRGCILYFGEAHKHFEDEEWQEDALGFLQAVMNGLIEVRSIRIGDRPALIRTLCQNSLGEWLTDGWVLTLPGFGTPKRSSRRASFLTDADFLRLQRETLRETGGEYVALPDDPYFSRVPADVPEGAHRFFDLLRERLSQHKPQMLDGSRTHVCREEEGGEVYLSVLLPHVQERRCLVRVDVYGDRCLLCYGNGRMMLDDEDWMDAALAMTGLVLSGRIEVRSVYWGRRLSAVVTRFLEGSPGRRNWTWRFGWRFLGRRRVTVWRTNYIA